MPIPLFTFLFIITGCLSGALGGLLGIGGGIITVPALYFILKYSGIFEASYMQTAIVTSLASSFITALVSTIAQAKKGAIRLSILGLLIPGMAVGCIIGAITGDFLQSKTLSTIFAIIAGLIGVHFLIPNRVDLIIAERPNGSLSFISVFIGMLSSLLGIGGGTATFPILLAYKVPVKNASATSSASTMITTLIGTIAYLAISWDSVGPFHTFGYIQVPAFLAISLGSVIFSPIGVKLSHTLHTDLIKKIFGIALILVGISMYVL